jgi:cell division protein FtsB
MNNLSAREKTGIYVISLLILILLGYILGIRTLNNKYAVLEQQYNELVARRDYLNQLKANVAKTTDEIAKMNESISQVELSFIDKIENECLMQYVLKTFEDSGIPYMSDIKTEDVKCPAVSYADGTASQDTLQCTRVNVTYATTDGYIIPAYNRTPDTTSKAEQDPKATAKDLIGKMGKDEYAEAKGYDEFLKALDKMSKENPGCIKVTGLTATSNKGFFLMTASIDFYGTILVNRVSVDNNKAGYTYWTGDTNVDTSGGFIGMPYIVKNENSLWNGFLAEGVQGFASRPFAAYWANAAFASKFAAKNNDLAKFLGVKNPRVLEVPKATKKKGKKAAKATPTPVPAVTKVA